VLCHSGCNDSRAVSSTRIKSLTKDSHRFRGRVWSIRVKVKLDLRWNWAAVWKPAKV
jgi:hypothetical protein